MYVTMIQIPQFVAVQVIPKIQTLKLWNILLPSKPRSTPLINFFLNFTLIAFKFN